MKEINSILKFKNYIVNEVKFINNEEFKPKKEGTPIQFDIRYNKLIDGNFMDITLLVEVFENAKENNYPFEMLVSLTGKFECEGEAPDRFIRNAIAILYPYVRSIVSTYTASANVNALILPAINVNSLIEQSE